MLYTQYHYKNRRENISRSFYRHRPKGAVCGVCQQIIRKNAWLCVDNKETQVTKVSCVSARKITLYSKVGKQRPRKKDHNQNHYREGWPQPEKTANRIAQGMRIGKPAFCNQIAADQEENSNTKLVKTIASKKQRRSALNHSHVADEDKGSGDHADNGKIVIVGCVILEIFVC